MKMSWLLRSNRKNLIVFFSGWGIEPSDMAFLNSENYDVAMLHGFTHENLPEFDLCDYEHTTVIAYSFGVYFSARSNIKADETYVFNGTLKPVDNKYGIREIIFKKTFKSLDTTTYKQFIRNMFDNDDGAQKFFKNRSEPSIKQLLTELALINALPEYNEIRLNPDKIFISRNDRVIPYKNQMNFWSDAQTEIIDSGHFPFYRFSSWDEIIKQCRK